MAVSTATKRWTLEELHSLPDDGNKYELIHGELFVTPPPTDPHETIGAKLHRILDPYVAANRLGYVFRPRSVVRLGNSEVEPDLMVRAPHPHADKAWEKAPIPILIVEIASPSTRRRDREQKRAFYMEAGVAEYWIVDGEGRAITVVRPGEPDVRVEGTMRWTPPGVTAPLVFEVGGALGE